MYDQFVVCKNENEINDVKKLLLLNDLSFESKVSLTICLYQDDHLIATGSIYENVIKMIAVDPNYQGQNLTAKILTHLVQILINSGIDKYFLYTKPENKKFFLANNFSLIYENSFVSLLENKGELISDKLKKIKSELKLNRGTTASIVMNCNPVTNGHMYLIETASRNNHNVIIFLVEENKSIFDFETRYKLLKKSTKHLKNVNIIPSTKYIISSATFPTYFLKEITDQTSLYMDIDISIFKNYFIPIFSIDFRYVGDEPLDQATNLYNQKLKEILKDKLIVIDRIKKDDKVISASYIRELAKSKRFKEIKLLTPKATYCYLKSSKGKKLFNE
jgi:[citrate (pro-3S)-lyase] ligase